VVAGRLAEAGQHVLLVEAGPDYGPFGDTRWAPELVDARLLATTHDWGYGQGRWLWQRAKVIGGCSSHNGAIAAVGHRTDYDRWGLQRWDGAAVAPVFAKVVKHMQVRAYTPDEVIPFHQQCLAAATDLGWTIASDLCDLDAGESFGLETVNVVNGTRWNTAFAYLDPVRSGGYLTILDRMLTDNIVDHPSGVIVRGTRNGEPVEIHADTLILAAGVYNTPAILQRSGIGDATLLSGFGIRSVLHQPNVGANLHDHPMIDVDRVASPELQRWVDDAFATGFLPEEQTLGKFRSTVNPTEPYDIHIYPVIGSNQTSLLAGKATIEVAVLNPKSRGHVNIAGPDPNSAPDIDHAYLSDPDGHDLAVMRDGVRIANELFSHPLVASIVGQPITDSTTDEAIRNNVVHYYHPVGTCAMGTDPRSVCDHRGRVNGLRNVVIADASLFPTIPRANTNLPTIMIGERIADMLLSESQPSGMGSGGPGGRLVEASPVLS
jgi:choline dehydrogenase